MPFLTPDVEATTGLRCRRIQIPDNLDLLIAVNGALVDLTKPSNWERSGTMTEAEAAALMLDMLLDYWQSDGCTQTGDALGSCSTFSPASPAITWQPNDPFRSPTLTPPGYAAPPWYKFAGSLLGAQPGDVLTDLTKIPINQTLPDLIGYGVPRFRFSWSNPDDAAAQVELHLLAVPQGGMAIITTDDDPATTQFIDLNSLGILDFDLQNLLGILSASPIQERVVELIVSGAGAHHIDVSMVPNISTQVIIGFGGGLRSIVLCGIDQPALLLPPFWDDVDDVDALPEPPAQLPEPDYYLPAPAWAYEGFLARSEQPGAKVQYTTDLNRIRLRFRARPDGADFRVLVDGAVLSSGTTRVMQPSIMDHFVTLPPGEKTFEIEHMGIIAPQAEGDPPPVLEIVRQDIRPPRLRDRYGDEPPTFEEIASDYLQDYGVELVAGSTPFDVRIFEGKLQKSTDEGQTWIDVGYIDPFDDVDADTLAPGAEATANIANRVLTFGIPQGIQGAQGATGLTGPAGPQGPAGTSARPDPGNPTGTPSDDLRCGAAQGVANYVLDRYDQLLTNVEAGMTIADAVLDIVVEVFDANAFIIAGVAAAAVSIGASILRIGFTPDYREDVMCAVFCELGTDGSFTESTRNAWITRIQDMSNANSDFQVLPLFISAFNINDLRTRVAIGSLTPSPTCAALCECGGFDPETLILPGNGSITTAQNTDPAKQYQITASGVIWLNAQGSWRADAGGFTNNNFATWSPGSLRLNGVPMPGQSYSASHVYTWTVQGTGGKLTFSSYDEPRGDNVGQHEITVTEL